MFNYLKSEWYRMIHSSTMYVFTGILAGLAFLINIVLYLLDKYDTSFRYGTAAFSLSNFASTMSLMFYVGLVIVSLLFSGEKKNGVLKNAIAFGISREEIFVGKCIVSAAVSVCSLIVILIVYMGSAVLLLEPGVEPNAVPIMLKGIVCMLAMAVAFEILAIALFTFFEKDIIAVVVWYLIVAVLPQVCSIIGLKNDLFWSIAEWMPHNYLSWEVVINMSGWSCLWETPEGVAKCLISGVIGVIVFLVLGLGVCKKQEV